MLFLTLPLTIFAPTLFESGEASSRAIMKRAITIFTSILLLSLACIRVAPTIIHQDTLVSTYGLRHLNFMDPAENYSQHWCAVNTCANETESQFISNCTNMTEIVGNGTGEVTDFQLDSNSVIDNGTGFELLCPSVDGKNATFNVTREKCTCECRRMYLTFQTFSSTWFPLLFALGLYCLFDAILTQWKHPTKAKDQTRWPCAYRLAENVVKRKKTSGSKEGKSEDPEAPEQPSEEEQE